MFEGKNQRESYIQMAADVIMSAPATRSRMGTALFRLHVHWVVAPLVRTVAMAEGVCVKTERTTTTKREKKSLD